MNAAHHVLLAIDVITPPEIFPGDARIRGRVIHVWEGSIPLGTSIEVTRRTARRDDAGVADAVSRWETIREAKYLDVYLDGSGSLYTVAGGGAMFLSAMPPSVKPPKDPVESAATAAITNSAIGCGCAPFAILGAIFAMQSISAARKSNRPVPTRAVVALALAGFIFVMSIVTYISWRNRSRQQEAAQQAIGNRLKGKREAASLDVETACDLVREQFIGGKDELRAKSAVTCRGPFEQTATTAVLKDVDAEFDGGRDHLTGCFGRTSHWIVIGFVASGVPCPAVALPPNGDEKSIRESAAEAFDRADADAFAKTIETVHKTLETESPHEHQCEGLDIDSFVPGADAEKQLKPAAFDLTGDPAWSFMTSSYVRDASDSHLTPHGRAASILHVRRSGGPYLIVYSAKDRLLPLINKKKGIIEDDFSYIPGMFDGWMSVIDTRTGKAVCQGKLSFTNSKEVRYSRRGPSSTEEKFRSAVQDDFEDQFKNSATEEIKKLSGGKLHLGYKFLE